MPHAHPGLLSGRKIEIPPERYTADLELHDRFLQFSGELMKLGLGGVAAIGILLPLLMDKDPFKNAILRPDVYVPLIISIASFVLAAGASLYHRFLAADGMFHHFRAIKLLVVHEHPTDHPDLAARFDEVRDEATTDERWRNRKFRTSERMLFAAGVLLFLGVLAFGSALIMVLAHAHT